MSPTLYIPLLLLSAAAAASASASTNIPQPMFADWIAQQLSAKVRAASYGPVETESLCLQQTKFRNCRCHKMVDDECRRNYFEATVSCCEDGTPGSFMTEKPVMGVCSYTEDFFGSQDPIKYDGTPVKKIGVFTATCEMREDSDRCGSPVCEGMSIKVTGDIMMYDKVAFIGPSALDPFPTDPSCSADGVRSGHHHAQAAAASEVASKRGNYKSNPPGRTGQHFVGDGHIYTGTFHVVSRMHSDGHSSGRFQYAFPSGDLQAGYTSPPTLPEKVFVAKAYHISLEFFKPISAY